MKLAPHFAAAARLWFVPLAGAVTLASACNAAPAPSPGSPTVSASARKASAPAATRRATTSRASAGIVIGIDPETGQVGPLTAEQMARLSAAMGARASGSTAHSAPVHRADGRVTMYVGNWMREYSVVRLGADGRPVLGCVDGHDAAVRLQHSSPAPAGTEER